MHSFSAACVPGSKITIEFLGERVWIRVFPPAQNTDDSLNIEKMFNSTPIPSLTKSEWKVAVLVATGMRNKAIAEYLNIQEQSVKNVVSGIFRKLHLRNRVSLAHEVGVHLRES